MKPPGWINKPAAFWGIALLLGLMLSSAASLGGVTLKDPEGSQEYSGDVVAKLDSGQAVGQSFVSRRPRLNGIQLWLRQTQAPSSAEALIYVELYHSPAEAQPIAHSEIKFSALARAFPVTVTFPAQADPPGQTYYVRLWVKDGQADLHGRAEDAYPGGTLYINAAPQNADAAFRLSYEYDLWAALADLGQATRSGWLALPLLLILWAPGRLLLWPLAQRLQWSWGERTALSMGISLALIPVTLLWSSVIGWRWERIGVSAVYVACILGLIALYWRKWRSARPRLPLDSSDLALAVVLIFTLGVRLAMTRDLSAPAWVDPVHHATITRLIAEQGKLPDNYAPYVQANTANYHPGFHSTTAVLHWLSGMEIADAMLLLGQVQNALCSLAVYLFATTLTKNRLAGILAALTSSFLLPMPAYYTSWGRYTQLAGLLILPTCIHLIQELRQSRGRGKIWPFLTASIACAGLFLTHYRVAAFMALWLIAFMLAEIIRSLNKQPLWITIPDLYGHYLLVGVFAIALSLPWWPSLTRTMLAPALASAPAPQPLSIDWGYLTPVYGKAVSIAAALGLLWSILRLRWFGPTLALWIGLMFLSANQGILRIPLAGNVNKTSVEITLFLPTAVLAGFFIADLLHEGQRRLSRPFHLPYQTVAALGAAVLMVSGARRVISLINPVTLLFRAADRPAMEWINANLPPDSELLINPFLWGYGVYAGQDGGYWITPMTGRRTLPPPALYGLGDADQFQRIHQASRSALEAGKDPVRLYDLLRQQGIRYVYLGARGGAISSQALRQSPLFRVLYAQDGVWIFERVGGK
jgi:hypothetical protein